MARGPRFAPTMTQSGDTINHSFAMTLRKRKSHFSDGRFERIEFQSNDSYSKTVDFHTAFDASIHYLRLSGPNQLPTAQIAENLAVAEVLRTSDFGIVIRSWNDDGIQQTLWFPVQPGTVSFAPDGRMTPISASQAAFVWEFYPNVRLTLRHGLDTDHVAVVPYVSFNDAKGLFFEELQTLDPVEQILYRKSNWFNVRTPNDLWSYLIDGSVYDPRSLEGINKRFKCQQCAYAWWNLLGFLHRETRKTVYTILQDEISYSILLDMSVNGEWGHGFWSDIIETHTRFHLDGVHLLLSQYEKTGEVQWLQAAERGMDFVFERLTDDLDDGAIWFLHDTIEHCNENKPNRFKSSLFGKSPGNTLCINTHVQTLTVLHRLKSLSPKNATYRDMFDKGVRALRRALEYQPARALYGPLMWWVQGNILRRCSSSRIERGIGALELEIIRRFYWSLCSRFPRLVQPGGLIERDLTLSMVSDSYHVVNLKDLLTLYQQEPLPWLRPYLIEGIQFTRKIVRAVGMPNVIRHNPLYIELIETLHLYDRLIEKVPGKELQDVARGIQEYTGGESLDIHASELVLGFTAGQSG